MEQSEEIHDGVETEVIERILAENYDEDSPWTKEYHLSVARKIIDALNALVF